MGGQGEYPEGRQAEGLLREVIELQGLGLQAKLQGDTKHIFPPAPAASGAGTSGLPASTLSHLSLLSWRFHMLLFCRRFAAFLQPKRNFTAILKLL
jgi:hypothetical protein